MSKEQRIRDPLHNLIRFQDDEFERTMWKVLQTRPFQRLRRVKQLAFSELVYPGATHSRFSHSIGTFHTARLLMEIIRRHLGTAGFEPSKANAALAAALVHDVGHGPFSHAFEQVSKRLGITMAEHEKVSDYLIRHSEISEAFSQLGSGFANDVAAIIARSTPQTLYDAVVSSQFDADRLDYMRRDRLMTGTGHGAIDFEWLINNLEVAQVKYGVDEAELGEVTTFVVGEKAIYAAETYVLGLFQLYPTVYFHKASRGAEKLFTELLFRVLNFAKENALKKTGLPKAHAIIKFAKRSTPENLIELDDAVITGALSMMIDAEDNLVSDMAKSLRDRKLYRSVNVRERLKSKVQQQLSAEQEKQLNLACADVESKINSWLSEREDRGFRLLTDTATRVPYKFYGDTSGPLNQIRIRIQSGDHVDLGQRSKVVQAIEPFKLFRVYVRRDDTEAVNFLNQCIEPGELQ